MTKIIKVINVPENLNLVETEMEFGILYTFEKSNDLGEVIDGNSIFNYEIKDDDENKNIKAPFKVSEIKLLYNLLSLLKQSDVTVVDIEQLKDKLKIGLDLL